MKKEEIIRKAAMYDEKYGTPKSIPSKQANVHILFILPLVLLLGPVKKPVQVIKPDYKANIATEKLDMAPSHL